MGDDFYCHCEDNKLERLYRLFNQILIFIMAVDPRLIMSGQFAEHLWLTSASNGTTSYFINKKGKRGGPDSTYLGGEKKMGKNEDRTIKNILNSVSTTDILNFKQEKIGDIVNGTLLKWVVSLESRAFKESPHRQVGAGTSILRTNLEKDLVNLNTSYYIMKLVIL